MNSNLYRSFFASLFYFFFASIVGAQDGNLLQNGSFDAWKEDVPAAWKIEIGATNGDSGRKSKIQKGDDGSLQLSGDRSTTTWNFVGQSIKVLPGESYQLTFSAKTTGVKREGNQFNNCYVGYFLKNAQGRNVSVNVTPIASKQYVKGSQALFIKKGVTQATIAIFLSKSGKLNVKDLKLKKLNAKDSFEILIADMDRNYSYFEHKKIDWKKLTDKYRDRAVAVSKDKKEFTNVITDMLAELKDMHTWVISDQRRISKFRSSWKPNFDFRVVNNSLKSKKQIGRFGVVGKTADGFGYVRITTLSGLDRATIGEMVAAIEGMFDTPGMIIDLRRNGGGAEPIGYQIASMFAEKKVLYGRQKRRSGPKHSDLAEVGTRYIGPRRGKIYTKPIVCLIGPGAVSSGEGFAMMFGALPQCTTVGQPTRGASGNPQPCTLPNGVEVWYSRWVSMTPDGKEIEDFGFQPDVKVEHEQGKDPSFQKAQKILKEQIK